MIRVACNAAGYGSEHAQAVNTARFLFVQKMELPGSGRNQIPIGRGVGHAVLRIKWRGVTRVEEGALGPSSTRAGREFQIRSLPQHAANNITRATNPHASPLRHEVVKSQS